MLKKMFVTTITMLVIASLVVPVKAQGPGLSLDGAIYSSGALGVSDVSISGGCEVTPTGQIHCDITVGARRDSWFWGETPLYIYVPIDGLSGGDTVYWVSTDLYTSNEGEYPDTSTLGMLGDAGCPSNYNIGGGMAGPGSCVVTQFNGEAIEYYFIPGGAGLPALSTHHIEFTFALSPINECNYAALDSTDIELDPVLETPLGPEGDPADDQIYTTVIDEVYTIELAGGPWNDGAADRGTETAISWDGVTYIPTDEIESLCQDGLYFPAESETLYIRVNDTAGNFADNTNNPDPVIATIIHVTPIDKTCESQFTYGVDDLVTTITVNADDEGGTQATRTLLPPVDPMTIGEWYAITVVSGTWQDDGAPPDRVDMEFLQGESIAVYPDTWHDLGGTDMGAGCASTDGLTWFMQAYDLTLWLRVNNESGDFTTNTGELEVEIYLTEYTRNLTECEYTYETYGSPVRFEVDGKASNGKSFAFVGDPNDPLSGVTGTAGVSGELPNQANSFTTRPLQVGAYYVIDIIEGPWSESSGFESDRWNNHYDMAVNDGTGWIPLADWTVPLCNVQIDALGHRRIYFQVPEGPLEWFFRVNGDGSFANNDGYLAWNLYRSQVRDITDPEFTPWANCTDNRTLTQMTMKTWIPVKDESGALIRPSLTGQAGTSTGTTQSNGFNSQTVLSVASTYVVYIQNGPWDTDEGDQTDAANYDAAISRDNGVTWYPIGENMPFGDCVSFDQQGRYGQIMFTVAEGEIWKIRVNDTAGNFGNNGGNLAYVLYGVSTLNPALIHGEVGISWNTCTDPIVRPSNPLDLAGWIDYAQSVVRRFFAWCPNNTASLIGALEAMKQREPFATITQGQQMVKGVSSEIDSYDWDAEGPTSVFEIENSSELNTYVMDKVTPRDAETNSIWNGGDIINISDFDAHGYAMPHYYNQCISTFSDVLPARVASAVCFVSGTARETGASNLIQISFDISCIFMLIGIIKRILQETIYMMTGVKPWTKSGADSAINKLLHYFEQRDTRDDVEKELGQRFGGRYGRNSDGTYSRR